MKAGRPRKEIDQNKFEFMCKIQCTQLEMCGELDCDENTLNRWCKDTYKKNFSEVFKQKRSAGQASLRRKGWKLAETNPAVWIFWAKNFLGMSDNPMPSNDQSKALADAVEKLEVIE